MFKLIWALAVVAVSYTGQVIPTQYARGERVTLRTPAPVPDVTVLAIGGDQVRMERDGVFVNDKAVTLAKELFAAMTAASVKEHVPAGHYFVAGDRTVGSSATLYWAIVPQTAIREAGGASKKAGGRVP
jgi:hypothetical protein